MIIVHNSSTSTSINLNEYFIVTSTKPSEDEIDLKCVNSDIYKEENEM